jgi:hypothetical protein
MSKQQSREHSAEKQDRDNVSQDDDRRRGILCNDSKRTELGTCL